LSQYAWGEYLLEQGPPAREVFGQVAQFSRLTGLLSGLADILVSAVIILTVGIFGAANPALYRDGLLHLVPFMKRERARETADAVAFNLRWWLLGQFFLMVVIGATTTLGLWLIGVPLAITLGLIAGMLEIVPYIGPWLSGVPAVLIALPLGPWPILLTVGLYLALHILEGYILLPLVQQKAVHLPPVLTLVMQALMGTLMGLMGLFVAAPLTVAAVVLVKMLYVKDTLGDPAGEPRKNVVPVVH
jgi:predicted PurR-regulated permease PerM